MWCDVKIQSNKTTTKKTGLIKLFFKVCSNCEFCNLENQREFKLLHCKTLVSLNSQIYDSLGDLKMHFPTNFYSKCQMGGRGGIFISYLSVADV